MERLTIDEVIEHCRKTCESIEMVAIAKGQSQEDITSKQYWEHYQVEDWLKELKQYKDVEEKGLLLKLPCKVGDTVYEIVEEWEEMYEPNSKYYVIDKTKFDLDMLNWVGKCVFLTKEEAEQKLEELKKGD